MTTVAVKRNGDMIWLNDEVMIRNYHPKCDGKTFVIFEMNEYNACESGVLCRAHLMGDPEAIIKSKNEFGIDTNWFEKV